MNAAAPPGQEGVFVLTLIAAAPDSGFPDFAVACADRLTAAGIRVTAQNALHPHQAHDLFCDADPAAAAKAFIASHAVDAVAQPAAHRRKTYLVADMESTLIEQEMLDEMAEIIGARDHVAAITHRAMNGELDFAEALRARVALFAGQGVDLLETMAKRITLMPGAAVLAATMKKHGAVCRIATGGFDCFADPVAARLGFDEAFANALEIVNGALTGRVIDPVLDRDAKLAIYRHGLAELNLPAHAGMAVGDGANDLPMLLGCSEGGGLGAAFRAKPAVAAQAACHIAHGDLTALLYAQGYKREDFCLA